MHIPTLASILADLAGQPHEQMLPDEVMGLVPNSSEAIELNRLLSDESLTALADRVTMTGSASLRNVILVVLHTRANVAGAEGRIADVERAFRSILVLNTADENVRAALAVICRSNSEEVLELVEPVVTRLLPNIESHRIAIEIGVNAAFSTNRHSLILSLNETMSEIQPPQVRAIVRRIKLLAHLKNNCPEWERVVEHEAVSDVVAAVARSLKALDEHGLLSAIRAVDSLFKRMKADIDAKCIAGSIMLCALAFAERWSMAWQAAQALLATLLMRHQFDISYARLLWSNQNLPPAAFTGVLARSIGRNQALRSSDIALWAPEWVHLLEGVAQAPAGLSLAYATWRNMLMNGDLEDVVAFAPIGFAAPPSSGDDVARASLSLPPPAAARSQLWYFITWHEDASRLLRLISVLQGEMQTIIVSVGGAKPPQDLGLLSTLLLVDRLQLLFRPAVTWGGPKLLYQNALEAFDAFDKLAEQDAWLQIICNRTYPLLSPLELSTLIAEEKFLSRHPNIPPPPAWKHEWSDEIVRDLPNVFEDAYRHVLETHTLDKFRVLAFDKTRLDPVCFNFSSRPEVLDDNLKDGSHKYAISPYSADMRWMSFGRMMELVDTATENSYTFSRRLPLHILKWVHATLAKHELRTGDPFVLVNRAYVNKVLHDPACIELFAAMNLGFAPEMNFMDTVSFSPQYGLSDSLGHQYYRNDRYEATEEDIGPANSAATIERRFFMRKTSPVISQPFIAYFSGKISQDWPLDEAGFVLNVIYDASLPEAVLPTTGEFIGPDLGGAVARLRDLAGNHIAQIRFGSEGRIWLSEDNIGTWQVDGRGLTAHYQINGWGTKLYERPMANADFVTLAPAEIISVRNGWSVLIEFELATLHAAHIKPDWIIEPRIAGSPTGGWSFARSPTAALLDAFIVEELTDYPSPVRRERFDRIEFRQTGEVVLAFAWIGGHPVLLRYSGFVFAARSGVACFVRATTEDCPTWDNAMKIQLEIGVAPSDLVGRYKLYLLNEVSYITIAPDGRIRSDMGEASGWWFADQAAVRLFGIPGLRTAFVRQFQRINQRMRLSGWGWRDIQTSTTFVLEQE